MGMSTGVVQSPDSERLKPSSPKSEHHGHNEDRKMLANKRNGKSEEHQLDTAQIRTSQVEASDAPGKSMQTPVAPDQKPKNKQTDFEKRHMQSIWDAEDTPEEGTPLRNSPQLNSTRVENLTDEQSFDNSLQIASTCDAPSRFDVSSVLEKTSLLGGDSSYAGDSTHFDSSFHTRNDISQFDSTSQAEEEPSTTFDTTRDTSCSVDDSRDDTLDSTREGETSEAEETRNSFQITGESTLESSLNNTSQLEEPPVDSSDVSNSRSRVSPYSGRQGTLMLSTV